MSYMVKTRLTAPHVQCGDAAGDGRAGRPHPRPRRNRAACRHRGHWSARIFPTAATTMSTDRTRRATAAMVTITQTDAGDTTAAVQITSGTPNTSYDFYWKCQRGLGQVRTDARRRG